MILANLTKAIREQNWFAVVLEFFIVIAGVVIGFQITAWNQSQADEARSIALKQRLLEEFNALRPELVLQVENFGLSRVSTGIVVDALRFEDPPADETAFRFALARSNWVYGVPPLPVTFSELITTGAIADIDDPTLRASLVRYGDAHARLLAIYPQATNVILDPQSNYYKAVDWDMDPNTWESPAAIDRYDWSILRASSAEMQGWIAFQYDLERFAISALENADEIIAILEDTTR